MYGNKMKVRLYKIVGVLRLASDMLSMYKTRHSYKISREYCTKEGTNEYVQKKRCQAFHMLLYVYNRNNW